jgi:hypothetical protein
LANRIWAGATDQRFTASPSEPHQTKLTPKFLVSRINLLQAGQNAALLLNEFTAVDIR